MEFDAVARGNLPTHVATQIEEKIFAGELKIGTRLPSEMNLAKMFGVSRNVLREAVAIVREWGLLDVRNGRGIYIQKPAGSLLTDNFKRLAVLDEIALSEFFEVRIILEIRAAFAAALNITDEELDILKGTVENMSSVKTSKEWADREYIFHNAIARAAGNKLLYILLSSFSDIMNDYFQKTFPMPHHLKAEASHRGIYNALRLHDAAKARDLMTIHLEGSFKNTKTEKKPLKEARNKS
jgi:DNA-binding FadR family transcriptional regulator